MAEPPTEVTPAIIGMCSDLGSNWVKAVACFSQKSTVYGPGRCSGRKIDFSRLVARSSLDLHPREMSGYN